MRNFLPPLRLLSSQSMTGSFQTQGVLVQTEDRLSIAINVLTGTAVGTFNLQGRTSYSGNDLGGVGKLHPNSVGPSTEWTNLPNTSQAAPAAGSTILYDVGYTGITEIRIAYTTSSSTGTCDIWLGGK